MTEDEVLEILQMNEQQLEQKICEIDKARTEHEKKSLQLAIDFAWKEYSNNELCQEVRLLAHLYKHNLLRFENNWPLLNENVTVKNGLILFEMKTVKIDYSTDEIKSVATMAYFLKNLSKLK